jgi:hypothetical protein
MLRSNNEVERYLLNRLAAQREALEGPRTLRTRPPPRVRDAVVNLDGVMSDLSDDEEEEDEEEDDASEEDERRVAGSGRPAKKARKSGSSQAPKGEKPQKVLTPVSSEETVKRCVWACVVRAREWACSDALVATATCIGRPKASLGHSALQISAAGRNR